MNANTSPGSDPEREALDAEILAWMGESHWAVDDARFEALALRLFAHQFAACPPYARFAAARGRAPSEVLRWQEIPAVPTGAFKEVDLRGFPESRTIKTFRTSGTSGQKRGELHLDSLALYEASLMASLGTLLFPDRVSPGRAPSPDPILHLRILTPAARESPDSSLSHMFQVLLRELGSPSSGFDVVDGRLEAEALAGRLQTAQARNEAVALCGTAFSFVHLIEFLEAQGTRFECAPGSRIMETGGFKGRSREMPRDELYSALGRCLGIPPSRIVNQYGMTELGSQFYDSVWIDPEGPRRKLGPPWVRVRLVDPESGEESPPGEPGMVIIHDLANTGSIAALQTADLGRAVMGSDGSDPGFEILGRQAGAEARGCSIAADEMLSA
ncbi:MAG: AMP-binding protein [Myxococcota bacterium]|nr:AMP-binding protein [Myxococcota bacterium]